METEAMVRGSTEADLKVDVATLPTNLFIGGAWVKSGNAKRIEVLNPSTEECLATIADATVEDGLSAVDAAGRAAAAWAATAPRKRAEILLAAYRLMIERADWLAELISLENGKALSDAKGEVTYAAEFFRWYGEEAVRINGEISVSPSGQNRIIVQYQPIGIAVLVTPWNFPAAMATRKIGRDPGRGGRAERGCQCSNHIFAWARHQRHASRSQGEKTILHGLNRGWPHPPEGGVRLRDQLLDGARRQCAVHRL
jgi:hypothetical protein